MSQESVRSWYCVGEASDIPLREGKKVQFQEYEVALFNLGREGFLAVNNQCPHQQGPLSDGIVSGSSVFCPLHNWQIDLQSGNVISGGEGCVKTYPVKEMDGKVYIAFQDGEL